MKKITGNTYSEMKTRYIKESNENWSRYIDMLSADGYDPASQTVDGGILVPANYVNMINK